MSARTVSNVSPVASSERDALLDSAVAAFAVTTAAKIRRAEAVRALVVDGMAEPAIAAALGKRIVGAAPSRATVGFYSRTGALYALLAVDSPSTFDALWSAVTRGEGVTFDALTALVIPGDAKGTAKAVRDAVATAKAAKADAAEAAKAERNRNEAAAEEGAMAAPLVAGTDYAALVGALVSRATTPEARKRLAVALLAGVEALNVVERESRAKVAKAA